MTRDKRPAGSRQRTSDGVIARKKKDTHRKKVTERKCVNHPDRPAHAPSHVLCEECFGVLDAKMQNLGVALVK